MFACEKQPATGSRGMVVTNHPLASGAGAQVLLAGGNAVDAAVAALFALTVVEPMMVGVLGGGVAQIRRPDGTHAVVDGLSTAPASARPDMYRPVSEDRDVAGRENHRGPRAVAVPGALAGWCHALDRYGTMPLADIVAPAVQLAERGFAATPYLCTCVADCAADLARDPDLAALFLPGGAPLAPGARVLRPDYAATLRAVSSAGPGLLYGGALGTALAAVPGMAVSTADLAAYAVRERAPIRGTYRGWEVVGPPPPASSGVHVVQMLNLLERFDVAALGFGTVAGVHLLAQAMAAAFADRREATADPDFVHVPVERLTSKAVAARRRMDPGGAWGESAETTHVTVADHDGTVVSTTQTLNGLFGACVAVPGTGLLCNDYMFNFDPRPGRALSIAPGKRVFTSMAPMMALRAGAIRYALGLPGALRIFPSAMQALVNLVDHGMSLQQAVEAPRVWTQGGVLEVEEALVARVAPGLRALGHDVVASPRVAGGMNAIEFRPDGTLLGAACWRADGTPVGIGGGLARAGGAVRHVTAHVVVLDPIGPATAERMRALLPPGLELSHGTARDEAHLCAIVAEADYAIAGQIGVSAAVLRAGRRLKLLHKWGVGVDNLDLVAARALGIAVARTTGSNAVPVAEFTLGLMLSALRGLAFGHAELQRGRWAGGQMPHAPLTLSGKTVGLVGFGAIGRQVARLLGGFGCTVLYAKPTPVPGAEAEHVPLPELLARADVVSLHCPLTPETAGMIDAAALRAMKRSAVLVNTARGGLVVTADLLDALRHGTIGAAAADVFEEEPLPADSPLRGVPNLTITPHIAASAADTFPATVGRMFANIARHMDGQALPPGDVVA